MPGYVKTRAFFLKPLAGESKAIEGSFSAAVCIPRHPRAGHDHLRLLPPHHSTTSPQWGVWGNVQGQILLLLLGRPEQCSEPLHRSPSKCCSLSQTWGKTWDHFLLHTLRKLDERGTCLKLLPARHHHCLVTQRTYPVLVLGS